MVDLPVGHGLALVAAALLGGCTGSSRPAALAPPQAANQVRHAMADALASGDRATLTRDALLLARMGSGMSDHGFDSFAAQLDREMLAETFRGSGPDPAEALRHQYRDNSQPYHRDPPERAAEVPAEYRIVEGIAYDRATDRLFIGTVVDGRLAYLHAGQWHEVPLGFPRSGLFGMTIDPRRRLLWIATGAVEETAVRDAPFAGLIAVDLDRLSVVERLPEAGEAGVPGDVAVGHDGTVYLSDSKTGAIERRRLDEAGLRMLVPPGRFRNPQGMAVSGDGRSLYVADYGTGLWIVRLRDGQVTPMRVPVPMMLDGIDGLVRDPAENALIAVQNGTMPRRVIKLYLSPDGRQIYNLIVREIVPGAAGDPGLATLKDDRFWYVGDGQWERYGPRGTLKDGKPPRPTPILKERDDEIVVT